MPTALWCRVQASKCRPCACFCSQYTHLTHEQRAKNVCYNTIVCCCSLAFFPLRRMAVDTASDIIRLQPTRSLKSTSRSIFLIFVCSALYTACTNTTHTHILLHAFCAHRSKWRISNKYEGILIYSCSRQTNTPTNGIWIFAPVDMSAAANE